MEEAGKRVHSGQGRKRGDDGRDPERVQEYDFFVAQSAPGDPKASEENRPETEKSGGPAGWHK